MGDPVDIFSDQTPELDNTTDPGLEQPLDIFEETTDPNDTLNPEDITVHPQRGIEFEPSPEPEPLDIPSKMPEGWTPGGPEGW